MYSLIYYGNESSPNSHYEKFILTGEVKCIDDEIPFELPKGWEWCRLGEVALVTGGYAFSSESLKSPQGIRVIRISDFNEQGWVNKSIVRYDGEDIASQYEIHINDLLLAMTGGTVGKSFFVQEVPEKMYLNQRVAIIRSTSLLPEYINIHLKSLFIIDLINSIKNSTNDNISMRDITSFPFPLPPLAEQQRIVAKIEELMPLVEQNGKAQSKLEVLNTNIREQLKKSILKYAIEGKLVPQCEEDGTAEDLLQEIQVEKQRLYAEGKLKKKDLTHSTIFRGEDNKYYEQIGTEVVDITEDIPYELPNGWSFCRLKDICSIFTGATFRKEEATSKISGVRILRGGNILPRKLLYKSDDIFLSKDKVPHNILLKKNDIVTPAVTSLENIGKMARVTSVTNDTAVGGFVFILRLYKCIDVLSIYLQSLLSSPLLIKHLKSISNKSGQAFYNIGKERLGMALLPIPTLGEQQRITQAIENLFELIEDE